MSKEYDLESLALETIQSVRSCGKLLVFLIDALYLIAIRKMDLYESIDSTKQQSASDYDRRRIGKRV